MINKLHEAFTSAGAPLYEVGGAVRDSLCGIHETSDIDFATVARPDQISQILSAASFKVIPIGKEFGTIQTIVNDTKIEITTFRCEESYTKGSRKPSVQWGQNIEQDLLRRDFTINAIAKYPDGRLIDPFNGIQDLNNGIIRTPISPDKSFTDDPLRILRAARFVARGFGKIHIDTELAMRKFAASTKDLSVERIFEEMSKLLLSDAPDQGLNILASAGVFAHIIPELDRLFKFDRNPGQHHEWTVWTHTLKTLTNTPSNMLVRWAALFHDISKPEAWTQDENHRVRFLKHEKLGAIAWQNVARRLKCSNVFRNSVSQLIEEHILGIDMGKRGVRRLIARMGDNLPHLLQLVEADVKAHSVATINIELPQLYKIFDMIVEINSNDPVVLKLPKGTGMLVADALGMKPGPKLGEIMGTLRQMLIDGKIKEDSDIASIAKGLANG